MQVYALYYPTCLPFCPRPVLTGRSMRLSKRRCRQLSVLVVPDDGAHTLEFKVSYWLLWAVAGGLGVLLVLVVMGGRFYWQARDWERVAQAHKRENIRLQAKVERVEELAQMVAYMKQMDQQLRHMLSSKVNLAPAAYSVPATSRTLLGSAEMSGQITTVVGHSTPRSQEPVDPRQIPLIWPISRSVGWVTAEFEERSGVLQNQHLGIDIAAAEGTVIRATADGMVVFAGVSEVLGQMVAIDHSGVFLTRYGHNAALLVSEGEEVRRGQPIALVGNSGHSSGPHLHYEVLEGGGHRNPRQYLP